MYSNIDTLKNGKILIPLVLIALVLALYVITLPLSPLWLPDETRYAEISREMLSSGNWIIPRFFELRYFEKPVAGYWLNNFAQWLIGHSNIAVRSGSVLATLVTAFFVFRMSLEARKDTYQALTATLIYVSSLLVYGTGTYAVLDPAFTLWVTASFYLFWKSLNSQNRRNTLILWFSAGVACGIAFMTKGFLAFMFPALVLLPWCLFHNKIKTLIVMSPLALAGAVITILPWGLAIYNEEPDFWRWFFWVEHIQRFASEKAQHKSPFWFYIPVLIAGILPWAGTLWGTCRHTFSRMKHEPAIAWIAFSVVLPFLFLSLASGKLLTYILPCFPPLAVLVAHMLCSPDEDAKRVLKKNSWVNIIFGVICTVVILTVISPWGILPVYTESEMVRAIIAAGTFILWSLFGFISLRNTYLAFIVALCPFTVGVLNNTFMPHGIIYAKQPQPFIENIRPLLEKSEYILVQNTGFASAVAWSMKRSDIIIFEDKGELEYGLSFSDAEERFVSANNFSEWLSNKRIDSDVSLLLYVSEDTADNMNTIPAADSIWRQGKFMLLHYIREPD
ncbi:TPA: lipid IV(A) 4-amino-4-deoxy-L-arabinosyltransferase [Enterobacter asburiae]